MSTEPQTDDFTRRDPFRPVARTAADVLAIIPHTLGYWPRRSVAILTAAADRLGPCLRVELPDPAQLASQAFVSDWAEQMTAVLAQDPVGTSMFVVIYADSGTAWCTSEPAADLLATLRMVGLRTDHEIRDAWCVAGDQWWAVDEPDTVHHEAEIRDSAVYAALVCDGSSVDDDDPSATLNLQDNWGSGGTWGTPGTVPGPLSPQMSQASPQPEVGDVFEDLMRDYRWHPKYLRRWDSVLSSRPGRQNLGAGDSQELVELMLAVVDPLGSDLILAAVLTGDAALAAAAWEQWETEACDIGSGPLQEVAEVVTGQWSGNPDWPRVNSCVRLIEQLIARAEYVQNAEATFAYPRDDPNQDPLDHLFPLIHASLWLTRGHLEFFRARGSRAALCAARARNIAPWHPGVQKLDAVLQRSPIPAWAADPATAWRR